MRGCSGMSGTKKARECCLNRRRFRAFFQNGVGVKSRLFFEKNLELL